MATIVVYPADLDLGETPLVLGSAGVSMHAVDFARLRERGGLQSLQATRANAIVVVPPQHPALAWISDDPQVVAILHPPLTGASLLAALRSAAKLEAASTVNRSAREGEILLDIARSLSSERDIPTLMRKIVRNARQLTNADAGSLFVIEDQEESKRLRFAVAQTGPDDDGGLMDALLPLSTSSIAGYVAVTGEAVNIGDAYAIPKSAPYTFNRAFDDAHAYRTKSILCVPMRNPEGHIIGAIQLINHKPQFTLALTSPAQTDELVAPFDKHDERLLSALASQAAVAMENARLVDAIQNLFERFVRASVKAIEVRDKSTQGHSERVAALTVAQAEAVNAIEAGPLAGLHFTTEQIREVRYASLLHDFGKVAVPEYIFAKAKKLPDGRLDIIRLRFLLAIEQTRDPEELALLRALLVKIESSNEPNVISDAADETLLRALDRRYRDGEGTRPLLEPSEFDFLSIPRGSLSDEERDRMQEHVTQSFLFLREIPWQQTPWRDVADLAYGHHEHLDGTGYPRKLSGDAILPQVRMMTISDVFDALTASDRPYKKGMSIERSLDILDKEFAQRGKIDRLLLDVFITKRLYEATHQDEQNPLIKHTS
ncbi:MAG: HD domain-containing phosphohydrolase [Vulcanimicrobiaceae bacterium]